MKPDGFYIKYEAMQTKYLPKRKKVIQRLIKIKSDNLPKFTGRNK